MQDQILASRIYFGFNAMRYFDGKIQITTKSLKNWIFNLMKFCYLLGRVRLLLSKGHSCYRPRRDGERRRKSVRGCIVDANLSALALVIVRKGEQVKSLTITFSFNFFKIFPWDFKICCNSMLQQVTSRGIS